MWGKLFGRGPSEYGLHIEPSGENLRAATGESLLQTALKAGLAFPHNCRVGGCGECKCRLVSGKVKELTDKSYLLSAEELQQGFILACQSRPLSDVVVEVTMRPLAVEHPVVDTTGDIVAITPMTGDILRLELVLADDLAYNAGQCAELSVPPGADAASAPPAGVSRRYSFASAPSAERPRRVDFFIRKVTGGAFTEWLFAHAKVGTRLRVRGPQGQFGLVPGSEPMLCVAGGSGLAPIKAVLEQAIAERQANRPLTIVFGARTHADLYGLDDIDQIRRQWGGRFRFVPILSAEPEGSAWSGARGMVADQLPGLLGERLGEQHAWLCGPPPMVDACTTALQQAGAAMAQIHQDKFLDASHGVAAAA